MNIDLKSMNRKQLEKLAEDVRKALQSAKARDRRDAMKAAQKAAAEFGFSLGELNEDPKPRKTRKPATKSTKPSRPSKPKFANPADASQTWTGKGRQPFWFRDQVAKGTAPEAMKI